MTAASAVLENVINCIGLMLQRHSGGSGEKF
jgi:hypothetical protein